MKHVACRVTVDGTLPEASPVEAALIQTRNIFHTMEHADTREGQSTCNLELLKIIHSVVLGLHREAQGASLSALPVGGLTWACFVFSHLPLKVCKHTVFSRNPLRTICSKHYDCGCAPQYPTDGGATPGRSHLGFASSLAEPHLGGRERPGNTRSQSGVGALLARVSRHDLRLLLPGVVNFDRFRRGLARPPLSASR